MATQNLSVGTGKRIYSGPFPAASMELFNTVDFSKFNGGSADVIQMIEVPKNTLVLSVSHKVITAEGGTTTGTIGDGSDANGWLAAVNNNAAADTWLHSNGKITLSEGAPNTIVYNDAYFALGGKVYTAADTIDMTLSANAVATAKIQLIALCVDLNLLV